LRAEVWNIEEHNAVTDRLTVCGGLLDPNVPTIEAEYNGQTYLFCTRGCLRAFWSNPEDFLAGMIEHPIDEDEGH
jgi:YHS domain-containing protein